MNREDYINKRFGWTESFANCVSHPYVYQPLSVVGLVCGAFVIKFECQVGKIIYLVMCGLCSSIYSILQLYRFYLWCKRPAPCRGRLSEIWRILSGTREK